MKLSQLESKLPRSPLDAETKRQTKVKIKKECRHLKQIYTETEEALDFANDETIEIVHTYCKVCGKDLTEEDLRHRNKTLEKFKKLR